MSVGTHFLGYCRWCEKVGEVRRQVDVNQVCPHCGADDPRGIDGLPDAKIAALVEEGQLTHDDLAALEVSA
jgi:Zn finger protein HypA/HybF involved in hydrogenase expression